MLDCTSITFERATAEDAAALLDLKKRVAPPKIYEPRVKVEDAINEIEANTFYCIRTLGNAGSGKTSTLAHRVAHLIVLGADPALLLP